MKKKIIIITIIALIVVIQFIRIDQTNPVNNPHYDYFVVATVPANAQKVIRESCYDCHSNETVYPWYANVAPISWMLQNHIEEGREHLNFSEWGNYSEKDRMEMLEDSMYEIGKGNMPLRPYVMLHPESKLTSEEKKLLRDLFLKESADKIMAALN